MDVLVCEVFNSLSILEARNIFIVTQLHAQSKVHPQQSQVSHTNQVIHEGFSQEN